MGVGTTLAICILLEPRSVKTGAFERSPALPLPVDGRVGCGGGLGLYEGLGFRVPPVVLIEIGATVVVVGFRTETSGFLVFALLRLLGDFVAGTRNTGRVGWMPVVGITRVLTTVVVIELKMSVVVVTVVEPPSLESVGLYSMSSVFVGSVAVPNIVREPIIVETKVLGGITVVSTDVIVKGLSRV